MRGKRWYSRLAAVVAGQNIAASLRELRKLVSVAAPAGNVMVFIDELHTISGGAAKGY